MKNTKNSLNILINSIKIKKKYIIIPYTKLIYLIFSLLKNYCIKSIYKLENWILIYITYNNKKNLKIKICNLKNKKNNFTYLQLQKIKQKNKDGIIFTSKGIYLLSEALKLKQGGTLFCLIYYYN